MIVLEHAYHGHTNTLIDISPYKFDGPGGSGRKPWVHVAPIADDYRGRYRRGEADAGAKYAQHVGDILATRETRDARLPRLLRRRCRASRGKLFFRRII